MIAEYCLQHHEEVARPGQMLRLSHNNRDFSLHAHVNISFVFKWWNVTLVHNLKIPHFCTFIKWDTREVSLTGHERAFSLKKFIKPMYNIIYQHTVHINKVRFDQMQKKPAQTNTSRPETYCTTRQMSKTWLLYYFICTLQTLRAFMCH